MKTLKPLLLVILMGLVLAAAVMAEEIAGMTALSEPKTVSVSSYPITIPAGEYSLQTAVLEFPPGIGMTKHIHGGYVLVTVLQGEMTLIDKLGERTIGTGGSWTEGPGDEHSVVNAGMVTTRVSANMLLPKGAEPTTMIKQKKESMGTEKMMEQKDMMEKKY